MTDQLKQLWIPATPTTYTLELTSRCNSACIGCGNVFERSFGDMPVAQWRNILSRLKPSIVTLRLTGGEPTLHPDFPAIIRLVDSLGVPFVLFSNGFWTKRDKTLALLLDCSHLDGVLISLHGRDAATHKAFTKVNSFDDVNTTIRQATRAGLAINTNTVLTRYNYQDIADIAQLSYRLGASFAAFSRYYGPPTPVADLTDDEFRTAAAMVHKLKNLGQKVQFNNCVPVCFDGKPTKSCPAGITHCTIDPFGWVRPCTHTPQVLGNILNQPIANIWRGQAANQWRVLTPPICQSCAEFARCRGACKAMAYQLQQSHDPLMQKPLAEPLPSTAPAKMQLFAGARPKPNFTLRKEAFGYLLINRNQIVPVVTETRSLLDSFDGVTTLSQIEHNFGQSGLAFVAYLFNKGLVHLAQ
jgi:radical SAM protein with 4Fe4S-binding SPASM domain